jgi:hypothetical protein
MEILKVKDSKVLLRDMVLLEKNIHKIIDDKDVDALIIATPRFFSFRIIPQNQNLHLP